MARNGFDWVKARHACSLAKRFAALKAQVERDVKTRNSLPSKDSSVKFGFGDHGESFIVLTEPHRLDGRSATFKLTEEHIEVVDGKGDVKFRITLTLNADGDCMFRIDGDDEEYDSWYIRQKALEDVFFGESPTPGSNAIS